MHHLKCTKWKINHTPIKKVKIVCVYPASSYVSQKMHNNLKTGLNKIKERVTDGTNLSK